MTTERDASLLHRAALRSGIREKSVDVLIVEDDDDARTMMASLLATNGCLVRGVATSDMAYQSAIERVPDVVVTDLLLRGSSAGWTLAEALREEPRTRHVALIAVTGGVEPRRAVVRPFDAYLRKPVETKLLLALVRQLAMISRGSRAGTDVGR